MDFYYLSTDRYCVNEITNIIDKSYFIKNEILYGSSVSIVKWLINFTRPIINTFDSIFKITLWHNFMICQIYKFA
jgi:hypothetical protein